MEIPICVIERYSRKNSVESNTAYKIFDELSEFLSLASEQKISPTEAVDRAWHEFILHTKEYTDYCLANFGKYIHHVPEEKPIRNYGAKCSSGCYRN